MKAREWYVTKADGTEEIVYRTSDLTVSWSPTPGVLSSGPVATRIVDVPPTSAELAKQKFVDAYPERVAHRFLQRVANHSPEYGVDLDALLAVTKDEEQMCGCPLTDEPATGGPHTVQEHRRQSCGGPSVPQPCGGCYDCVLAQIAHAGHSRIEQLMNDHPGETGRHTLARLVVELEQAVVEPASITAREAEVLALRALVGDDSVLTDEQREAWKNCSRVEAIKQADDKHNHYMGLWQTFEVVRRERDAALGTVDETIVAISDARYALDAQSNLLQLHANKLRHVVNPTRAKAEDDVAEAVSFDDADDDEAEQGMREHMADEREIAAGLREPRDDPEDYRSPGVEPT